MYVFGYGSLLAPEGDAAPGVPARLCGWRRSWGVAMDNTRDLPGYKHYLDSDGRRPPLLVAFLDVAPAPGQWVNGLVVPVDEHALAHLDLRERNYRRVEVGAQLADGVDGPVWTYVGRSDARERRSRGLREGRLAVAREYHDLVLGGFAGLGSAELAAFRASTAALPCPLAELRTVSHGPVAPAMRAVAAR